VPALAPLIPSLFVLSGIFNVATAVLLARTPFAPGERDAGLVLCFANAATGTFALTLALIVPISAASPPVIDAGLDAVSWTYAFWRGFIAATSIWYVFIRKNAAATARAPHALRAGLLGAFFVATGAALVLGLLGNRLLPRLHPLLAGPDVAPFREGPAGFVVLGLAAAAFVLALSIERPTNMDRAVAIAMVAVASDVLLTFIGARDASIAWFAARLLTVFGSAMVVVNIAAELLQNRAQLIEANATLAVSEAEATLRAKQFRAIWQSATIDGLSDADYLQAVTDLGTVNLRPNEPTYGYVSHFEDERLIVEVISLGGAPYANNEPSLARTSEVSTAFAGGSVERELLRVGRTTIGTAPAAVCPPWATYIGAPLRMGAKSTFSCLPRANHWHCHLSKVTPRSSTCSAPRSSTGTSSSTKSRAFAISMSTTR
jgi:hypothetical protein